MIRIVLGIAVCLSLMPSSAQSADLFSLKYSGQMGGVVLFKAVYTVPPTENDIAGTAQIIDRLLGQEGEGGRLVHVLELENGDDARSRSFDVHTDLALLNFESLTHRSGTGTTQEYALRTRKTFDEARSQAYARIVEEWAVFRDPFGYKFPKTARSDVRHVDNEIYLTVELYAKRNLVKGF